MASSVSFIVPATDETYSLEETVVRILAIFPERPVDIIVVTSLKLTTAACRDTIKKLRERYHETLVSFDQKRPGIGGAVQDAFGRAKNDYVVLMASDLETDPDILPELIGKLDDGYDISVASRWNGGARFSGYRPIKLILNFFFQFGLRVLYFTPLSDLTYAYRAYRREVVRHVRWDETRFPFFLESILKPLRLGYRITEIAAPWKARTEGVSHATNAQIWAYVLTALRIRFMKKSAMVHSPS
jgi:glycosyltransferase involved in cell wall biosynthesis